MSNNGQICVSPKRILVHQAIFDAFLKSLIEHANMFPPHVLALGHEKVENSLKGHIKTALAESETSIVYGKFLSADNEVI